MFWDPGRDFNFIYFFLVGKDELYDLSSVGVLLCWAKAEHISTAIAELVRGLFPKAFFIPPFPFLLWP